MKSLNYALHGEIKGAILDNGDFVHMKPKGAKEAGLKIGQKLPVEGEVKPSSVPHRIIEARRVNGEEMSHPPKKLKPKAA